jgi:hypothetical protein
MGKSDPVNKWQKTGPVAEINRELWMGLDQQHRVIYNLYKRKQKLEAQLESINNQIGTEEAYIWEELDSNPAGPVSKWAWIEIMKQTKPKWKEIALSLNKTKALRLAKEYVQKEYPFLRIKYIHPED